MVKISLIIPINNTREYIEECVQSVIDQTLTDIEIILINDKSEDMTVEEIDDLKSLDNRIKTFHLDEQMGVGAARNFGLKKVKGEYVYFLDSDDFLGKNTLELLANHIGDNDIIVGKVSKSKERVQEEQEYESEHFITENKVFNKESVLNCLISKKIIENHGMSFSEEVSFFSEYKFIVSLIKIAPTHDFIDDALYYKRTRKNPLENPSLFQTNTKQKIIDFLNIYNQLKLENIDNAAVNKYLDEKFIERYERNIVPYLRKRSRIEEFFPALISSAQVLQEGSISEIQFFTKKEIRMLKKGKRSAFERILILRRKSKKLKKMFKSKNNFFLQLHQTIFSRLPVKQNLIIFESFLGKSYSDNPKSIYEHIQNNHLNYECVWVFAEKGKKLPGKSKQVKRFSLKHYYYLARAKYWIINARMPKSIKKRKETVYLQTWHGTPLKKLGVDIDDVQMPGTDSTKYKKNFVTEAKRWDYLIAPNGYSSDIFEQAFQFERTMLKTGYPRNDVLIKKNNPTDTQLLKQKMGLPMDKKIILYAPTWRDNEYYSKGNYKFDIKLDFDKMKDALGDEYILLLRMHYLIADNLNLENYQGFAYDLSNYDDIAELYLVSDVLITDYSSVMFDYANTKRPILFYTYDLETYRDTLRGFYFDFEKEAPGPLLKTTEELNAVIKNLTQTKEEYQLKYTTFYEKFCGWEDGNATEKVFNDIFNKQL